MNFGGGIFGLNEARNKTKRNENSGLGLTEMQGVTDTSVWIFLNVPTSFDTSNSFVSLETKVFLDGVC